MEFTQSVRKLISSAAILLIAAGSILGQTSLLLVSGTVNDDGSGRKLPGTVVVVYQDDVELDRQEVDKNAGYEYELELGHNYTFSYEREGFTSKKVIIDVSHTPTDGSVEGFGFDLDMRLFKDIEGFDTSILDEPIGMGAYNPDTRKFAFDSDHTERMKLRIENEMNRLAAIEENRDKNKRAFDVAMKAGETAMKKKKWQDALSSFNEALNLIPDEQEAIELRDECRAKLDEIAAKDAEKQAEEDAKRAEEEAKAAAKEAERLAREEEARKRKEEAEARRKALNNPQSTTDVTTDQQEEQEVEDDFVPRDREVAEDNSEDRRAQEEAEMEARRRAAENAANAEAEKRRKEQEAEAKRAELLAKSANNRSDDADQFFREALKSENQARAAEIEQKKQSGRQRLDQREDEARDRKNASRSELDDKVAYNDANDDQAEQRAREKASIVVQAHRSQQEFIDAHKNIAVHTRSYYADQIRGQKNSQINLDKSVDKTIPQPYRGRAAEHQDEIEYTQSLIDAQTTRQKGAMDQRRIDSNSGGYDQIQTQQNSYRGEYERNAGTPALSKKDEELPQGFHEYSYEIPNGTVIELTFRDGDKVVRYKKVLMKTGTFYFRDNKSITASIFHRETTVVHD
ncbi:MAG: hypothetical protein CMB32_05600 [Euryarchaeota archaeon]|mgnify:CR=1 FL=1|nr:hypothetical protein [Euryarchaeota archaeon]